MNKYLFFILLPLILYAQVIDTVIPLFNPLRNRLLYIPYENKLYINLDQARQLLVLDCSSNIIRKIIRFPLGYPGAAYGVWNWRRNKIYYSFNPSPDSIVVIDSRSDSIIKWIDFPAFLPLCYNSIDDKIYATRGSSVAVIDCVTDSIVKSIPPQPHYLSGFLVWDSIENKVYCGSDYSDKVTVINCANDSVIALISTGVSFPRVAVYNSQRRKLYVAGLYGQTGAVIDAIGDTLIKNFYPVWHIIEDLPMIWNSMEDKVYWPTDDSIYIIDCESDSIIKTMGVGGGPAPILLCLSLASWSNRLYFASQDHDTTGFFNMLYVLDCSNDSIISNLAFGRLARWMTSNPQNHRIYIADKFDSALYVIRDEIPGIEEIASLSLAMTSGIEIYPNPAKTVIRVRYPWSNKGRRLIQAIKIFDVSGKLIREITAPALQDHNDIEVKISLKGISPGIYFLRLGSEIRKYLVVR